MAQALKARRGISFEAPLIKAGSWTILRLPKSASSKLPSRGMVMIEGTIGGFPFKGPLEPDGRRGHWLKVTQDMLKGAKAGLGDTVTLQFDVSDAWPEPEMPSDLKQALKGSRRAYETWEATTPAAHWDWIRWIRATKNPETRRKRIGVALSKLGAGDRRPCCFNRNTCTEADVSSNGVLLGT